MALDNIDLGGRVAALEWPTLGLILLIFGSWSGLCFFHDALPAWLWLPAAAWTAAWWGSVQHEIIHGHPTRHRRLNTALGSVPIWLWLPFERYRQTHLVHHRDERLTDPLDDPESRYWTAEAWAGLGPVGQRLVAWQATLLGRLVIGPPWSILLFWRDEVLAILAGDRSRREAWLRHLAGVLPLLWFVLVVCEVPLWLYVTGFVYLGTALAMVRSFCEHRALDPVEWRTAVVERATILGPLFLHNNLHVVHHRWPTVPWYRLPGIWAANREALVAGNGGLLYRSYWDVARRYLLWPHDRPVHPRGRAPAREAAQAGTG